MIQRDKIKDWTGRIIGIIETDTVSGNKVVKDWHGKILGRYIKRLRIIYKSPNFRGFFIDKNFCILDGTPCIHCDKCECMPVANQSKDWVNKVAVLNGKTFQEWEMVVS